MVKGELYNKMIGFALMHTLKLSKYKNTNYNGTYDHYDPITVKCYKEERVQKVMTSNGDEVTSKASYYTQTRPDEKDLINGNTILAIEDYDMLGCKYYRSYT